MCNSLNLRLSWVCLHCSMTVLVKTQNEVITETLVLDKRLNICFNIWPCLFALCPSVCLSQGRKTLIADITGQPAVTDKCSTVCLPCSFFIFTKKETKCSPCIFFFSPRCRTIAEGFLSVNISAVKKGMKDSACGKKTASQTCVCIINYRLCADFDVFAENRQVEF